MSLLTYQTARPWAKSIAKAVRTGEMPPWSGESEKRHWKNDISLTDSEVETILEWVEQGARRGNPDDLPPAPRFSDGWTLGEPDYVIELSPVDVPAAGEDLFPQEWIDLDIEEEHWVRAIEYMPGDRRATHHFQATYNNNSAELGTTSANNIGILGIWTAGMPPYVFPDGMGRIIAPGTRVLIDSHYHPFGEATTDATKIGLYFGEGELKHQVMTIPVANTGIRIPPGAPNHAEKAFYKFDRDMQILAFSPHMHVRGKAMRYDLTHPDGTTEILLDVPNYNYNWQWLYYPTEPIQVPAGSRVDVTAVWDNSENNPDNPDPSQEIIYRGDVFNEMFVGFMEVAEVNNVYDSPMPNKDKILSLLSAHPADESYFFGGFLPFGAYVPKDGEGWMYVVNGSTAFTITLDNIQWHDDGFVIRTELPTPEASATHTIVTAEFDDEGRAAGTLEYGVDSDRPLKVPVMGQPVSALVDKPSAQSD